MKKLKSASCLSKITQTWREKSANSSEATHFSGKLLRPVEQIRPHGVANVAMTDVRWSSWTTRLKSAKNLYLRHRFFCKIRQIHRFF